MENTDGQGSRFGRRELLLAGAAATLTVDTAPAQPPAETQTQTPAQAQIRTQGQPPGQATSPMSDQIPIYYPQTEFVYEAIVDIAAGMNLGVGPLGQRAMVPITGGTFEGPDIRGTVLPGGADRQLVRADGHRLLDALYELRTDDDAIITVRNQVLTSPERGVRPLSSLQITAPEGRYSWLNASIHVGTLDVLIPERNAVLVRVFRLV